MLAKNGKIIADGPMRKYPLETDRVAIDGKDGKAGGGCHALHLSRC